ncbi:hypothetical protein [Dawidia soli]|uniref:Uncharacterized protein n=1 Tax=Dawidia soli TaxID=2782352 RepID=A0AAP2D848_9BACT|nr:hypothetical protein [Dawidia soli]MBT1686909.1 hypothetical protein [Dawidia soli]
MTQITGTTIIVNVLFFLASCVADKRENTEAGEKVLVDVLPMIVDSLSTVYDLNDRYLVHLELIPDKVEYFGYDNLTEYFSEKPDKSSPERLVMLDSLRKSADDSLRFSKHEMTFGSTTLYFDMDDSLLNDPKYYGTFSLSNVVFDHTKNKGALYVAINCGNDCSRGMIFFIKVQSNKWVVDRIYQVWG